MFNQYYGGYVQPQQQIVPQPQPYYQQPQPQLGTWTIVKDYKAVQAASIPADGTQSMFMLESEPVFYICYMQGGKRMVQGYSFKLLDNVVENKAPMDALLERLNSLENKLNKITNDLGVVEDVQSDSTAINSN